MTKDENIWGNIRFAILLVFTVVLIFIILCKYVFDVPMKEVRNLLKTSIIRKPYSPSKRYMQKNPR